jgi:N-acetylmuramoyl-L-alanine amidase
MEEHVNHRLKLLGWMALLFSVLLLAGCESYSSGAYGPGAGHFTTVVVDAGHGAHDTGARAVSGMPEKLLTLDTARRLAIQLRKAGFRVIETRTTDYFVPLGTRTDISNKAGSAIFVSIHYNWDRKRSPNGMEIYYYSPRSKRLAANILDQTQRAYKTSNRGIKQRGFYVLRNNRKPAVLCELGFVSSPNDNSYVQSAAYRQKLAEKIAAGIIAEKQGRSP